MKRLKKIIILCLCVTLTFFISCHKTYAYDPEEYNTLDHYLTLNTDTTLHPDAITHIINVNITSLDEEYIICLSPFSYEPSPVYHSEITVKLVSAVFPDNSHTIYPTIWFYVPDIGPDYDPLIITLEYVAPYGGFLVDTQYNLLHNYHIGFGGGTYRPSFESGFDIFTIDCDFIPFSGIQGGESITCETLIVANDTELINLQTANITGTRIASIQTITQANFIDVWERGKTFGYEDAQQEYGYYDPNLDTYLTVEQYLELYNPSTPSDGYANTFYSNFDKYFIPSLIIIFGGAIILTAIRVFRRDQT